MKIFGIIISCLIIFTGCTNPEKSKIPQTGSFLHETFTHQNNTLPYRILYPKGFDGIQKFPVLFFLHGSGERGDDNETQLIHGSRLFLDSMEVYPCIVIFPQCDTGDYWANIDESSFSEDTTSILKFSDIEQLGPSTKLLNMLIDSTLKMPTTDTSRFYLAGLSMGGMGVTQLLANRPHTFAAATVICGAAPMGYVKQLASTPTQIFQGQKDNVVFPINSTTYYNAINQVNKKNRLILYPEVNHESWNNAFAEPDFLSWIFKHHK